MNTKENLAKSEKKVVLKNGEKSPKRKKLVAFLVVLNVIIFVGLIFIAKYSYRALKAVNDNQSTAVNVSSAVATDSDTSDLKSEISSSYDVATCGDQNQFVVPVDAAENGELLVGVAGLDNARKRVSEIAGERGGTIYSTNLSYASNSLKRGTMVVQIPADKFGEAFEALKSVGTQILRESTQKITPNNFGCPMPMAQSVGAEVEKVATETKNSDSTDKATTSDSTSSSASTLSPACLYPQTPQDKAYIKVTFVDNKKEVVAKNNLNAGKAIQAEQEYRNRAWLAFLIKIIFVILLFVILIVLIIRAFRLARHARRERKNKLASGVATRQIAKSRKVMVKTKKK